MAHKFRELVHCYYSSSIFYLNCKVLNSSKVGYKYLTPSLWLCQHYLCAETCIHRVLYYNADVNIFFLYIYICMIHGACDFETSTVLLFCDKKSFTWHTPSYAIRNNLEWFAPIYTIH